MKMLKYKAKVEQDTSTDVSTSTNGRQDEDQESPKVWVLKSFLGFDILAPIQESMASIKPRCGEVVAHALGVLKELGGHHRTHCVAAAVPCVRPM